VFLPEARNYLTGEGVGAEGGDKADKTKAGIPEFNLFGTRFLHFKNPPCIGVEILRLSPAFSPNRGSLSGNADIPSIDEPGTLSGRGGK
jgi:hypothetical protein